MAAAVHDRVAITGRGWPHEGRRGPARPQDRPDLRVVTRGEGENAGWPARAVLAAVVVVALLAVGGSLADAAGRIGVGDRSTAPAGPAVPSTRAFASGAGVVHVVQPGQTYWSIAEELGGPGDIRTRVAALEEANDGRLLRAGDRLVLPG